MWILIKFAFTELKRVVMAFHFSTEQVQAQFFFMPSTMVEQLPFKSAIQLMLFACCCV